MNNVLAAYFTSLQYSEANQHAFLHSSMRFSSCIRPDRRTSIKENTVPSPPKFRQLNLDHLDHQSNSGYQSARFSRRSSPLQSRYNITPFCKKTKPVDKDNARKISISNKDRASAIRTDCNNRIYNSNSRKLLHFLRAPVQWKFVVDGAKLQKSTNEFIIARSEEMMRTIRHPRWNVPGKEVVVKPF